MSECDNCQQVFDDESSGMTTVKEMCLCERCIDKLAMFDILLVQAKEYERALVRLNIANDDEEVSATENISRVLNNWKDRQLVTK